MIYLAIMHLCEPGPDGELEQIFASLDDENYLPVTRRPEPTDVEALAALFEGDGNMRPMTWARRAMRASWWPEGTCSSFEHETIETK